MHPSIACLTTVSAARLMWRTFGKYVGLSGPECVGKVRKFPVYVPKFPIFAPISRRTFLGIAVFFC